ncbi:hypothetical protein BV372_16340 [Nostoc sp. T09]|nr:hypothetical protein BV372_16340 [Nostoc sp. T09]
MFFSLVGLDLLYFMLQVVDLKFHLPICIFLVGIMRQYAFVILKGNREQRIDFLQKSVKGKGEKGKGIQNPFPLTFSLSPLLQKYIFARGLIAIIHCSPAPS